MKEDKTTSNIPTEEEVKRSDLYLELTSKLGANTRKLEELDNKSSVIKKEWSTALADAEISKKALEDMQSNFSKRWAELTDGKEQKADVSEGDCESGESAGISSAKEIITLQHKLTQALESVRQGETLRKTLNEAVSMNNLLQSKVDEFKAKYNEIQWIPMVPLCICTRDSGAMQMVDLYKNRALPPRYPPVTPLCSGALPPTLAA